MRYATGGEIGLKYLFEFALVRSVTGPATG